MAMQKKLPILLCAITVSLGALWIAFNLYDHIVPVSWNLPKQDELTFVSGTFDPTRPRDSSPYSFRENNGEVLKLGCSPGDYSATCIEDAGIALSALANGQTKIGYFYSLNRHIPSLSNVLVTLDGDGGRITYAQSQARLNAWNERQVALRFKPAILIPDILIPTIVILVACFSLLRGRRKKVPA